MKSSAKSPPIGKDKKITVRKEWKGFLKRRNMRRGEKASSNQGLFALLENGRGEEKKRVLVSAKERHEL